VNRLAAIFSTVDQGNWFCDGIMISYIFPY
jgi:hypothetical protein